MAWKGGRTRTSGQGRPKGTPNKVTRELREMILTALDKAGGVEYLTERAKDTPGPFMTLLGKVLPTTITGQLNVVRTLRDLTDDELLAIASGARTAQTPVSEGESSGVH